MWAATAVRLLLGIALWFAAPGSRTPITFQVLAVVTLVAAAALPLIGTTRYQALIAWWTGRSRAFIRAWAAASVGVGLFLLWSALA